jgi:hypothetical protein
MEPSGVWYDWLAPPGFFFWVVLVIGGWMTFGLINNYFNSYKRKSTYKLILSMFTAFGTLSLIHFFGDTRALGWLYGSNTNNGGEAMWFLAPFGLVFWLLIAAEFVGLVFFVRMKKGWLATVSIIATLGILQFATGLPVFQTMWQHPFWTLGGIAGYVLVGIIWFLFKWDRFTKVQNRLYREVWLPWLEEQNITEADFAEAPVEVRGEWWEYFQRHNWNDDHDMKIEFRPKVWAHKADFMFWMSLWPWSMIETFLADFLVELWLMIYHRFSGLLTRIRDRNWRGTEGHEMSTEEMEEFQYNRSKKKWAATGQRLLDQWTDLKGGGQPGGNTLAVLENDLNELLRQIRTGINSGDTETANLQSDLETASQEVTAASQKGWGKWLPGSGRNTI